MGKFEDFYEKNYKKLIIFSYLILLISIVLLGVNYSKTGEFFNRDISLKGGISVTIYNENINIEDVKALLKENFKDYNVLELTDFNTNKKIGLIIEVADINELQLREVLKTKYDINFDDKNEYDPGLTNSSFGESFYRGLLIALLFSFILMSIFIFFSFKTFAPSLAIISATFIDILATLAILNIFGVKISAAGIAAFLLIIGYSIDNNILLTTALLKRREGALLERLKSSMKTGMTITIAGIAVSLIGYFLSVPEELKQIFLIITIASLLDIITTYAGNAGILIRYCKKKNIT
ncbi:MAG: hypothetical protein AABW56_01605 [Nanoarchaeota archaeon]